MVDEYANHLWLTWSFVDNPFGCLPATLQQPVLAGKEFRGNTGGASDSQSLPLQNVGVPEDGVEDMTRLDYLHEPAILFNLRRRFFRALPYTYTGDIVIACNPYRWAVIFNVYGVCGGRTVQQGRNF